MKLVLLPGMDGTGPHFILQAQPVLGAAAIIQAVELMCQEKL